MLRALQGSLLVAAACLLPFAVLAGDLDGQFLCIAPVLFAFGALLVVGALLPKGGDNA